MHTKEKKIKEDDDKEDIEDWEKFADAQDN